MSHRNNFTLLRLVLAVMIVVTHCYGIASNEYEMPALMNHKVWGSIRLNMFFFISGYLVTASAFQSKNIFSFLMKRVLRIYPALIILVLITVFIIGPLFSSLHVKDYFSDSQTWRYLSSMSAFHIEYYLPGLFEKNTVKTVNASLWTLTLELKLYLLLLLSIVSGFLFTKYYKWFALISSVGFIALALTGFTIVGTSYDSAIWQLAAIYQLGSFLQVIKISKRQMLICLAASFVFLFVRSIFFLSHRIFIDEVLFYSFLTLVLAYYPNPGFRLKNDYSYGLYLYGFPVQQIILQLSEDKIHPALDVLLTLLIAGCMALLSWKFIERPALDLKKYLK